MSYCLPVLASAVIVVAAAGNVSPPFEQARIAALNLGHTCKTNRHLAGPCFATRGRIKIYNGSLNVRLWRIGTNRLVAIVPDDDPIMPEEIKSQLGFSKEVFGDYVVCPFTAEAPGVMQLGCVASASNVRIQEFQEAGPATVRKLNGEFQVHGD